MVFLPWNPTCYDAGVEAEIQSNGGRNDVATVKMWALFGSPDFQQDVWGFFSPCTSPSGAFTTSMIDAGECNQFASQAAAGGPVTEVTASGSYMVSQTALPFAAPGKLRGLTLQRLFDKVLTTGAPDLFMSSFNEHIGGRQAPASGAKIAFNMGLPNDPQRDSVWVDSYGSEFSRDVEPTVEGGAQVWNVTKDCVQMYVSGRTCDSSPDSPCCNKTKTSVFANIWSLHGGNDYLLTQLQSEKDVLVKQGWQELCSVIPGPSVFCLGGQDGRNGPFILYNTPDATPNLIALYRCFTDNYHFFSIDPKCEGWTTESVLGYISTQRGGETLRALRRCLTPEGHHTHALDLECDLPDTQVFGYVR